MKAQYSLIFRFVLWGAFSVYLWRTALAPRSSDPRGTFDRFIRALGGVITLWLALVALGRYWGLLSY